MDVELQTEPCGDDKSTQSDIKQDCKAVQTEAAQSHVITQTEWQYHCKEVQTAVDQYNQSAQTEPTNIAHVATQWHQTNYHHTYVQVHRLGEGILCGFFF